VNWIDLTAVVTATAAFVTMAVTMVKLGRMAGILETTLSAQNSLILEAKADVKELKVEFKEVSQVIITLAVQQTRMDTISAHLVRVDKTLYDILNGKGFVQS
jgi:hypothetical protein